MTFYLKFLKYCQFLCYILHIYIIVIIEYLLCLCSCSDGGIEEMVNELSNGKMLYAYLKVLDPNTSLPKSVLVNWVSNIH